MKKTSKIVRAILLMVSLYPPLGLVADQSVFVLYPEAPEPYREAFEQIIDGFARTVGRPLRRKMTTAATGPADLQEWLASEDDAPTVVLLGQQTQRLYDEVHPPGPSAWVGGTNALPGQTPWPGVSLVIDPDLYLRTLRDLLPDIRRVIAIHHERDRVWVPLVKQAADRAGTDVVFVAVADADSAVRRIAETLETLDSKTTALWFAKNTIGLDTELLYPFVLEEAWRRKIAVFSDTIAHAKRGFLFALYPDYAGVGAELGERVRGGARRPATGLTLTRAARLALNIRTARHLGVVPTPDLIRRASPLFPHLQV